MKFLSKVFVISTVAGYGLRFGWKISDIVDYATQQFWVFIFEKIR